MSPDAGEVIALLNLQRHPEGGWYRRVYQSDVKLADGNSCGSAIYYLLEQEDFSAFHRMEQDELLHHYQGAALDVHQLRHGQYTCDTLGNDLAAGQRPQLTVKSGTVYSIVPRAGQGWALIGCTVCPEFRFDTFTMPSAQQLLRDYPAQAELILRCTRAHGAEESIHTEP